MSRIVDCYVCGTKSEEPDGWGTSDLCDACWQKNITSDYKAPHCKWPEPYTYCRRTDVNENGLCHRHASTKCDLCGQPGTDQCARGDTFICGTVLCDFDDCKKKHNKAHRRAGGL